MNVCSGREDDGSDGGGHTGGRKYVRFCDRYAGSKVRGDQSAGGGRECVADFRTGNCILGKMSNHEAVAKDEVCIKIVTKDKESGEVNEGKSAFEVEVKAKYVEKEKEKQQTAKIRWIS
ncbi:unnamed protein product [Rhodiola kirilowii]